MLINNEIIRHHNIARFAVQHVIIVFILFPVMLAKNKLGEVNNYINKYIKEHFILVAFIFI